MYWKLNLPKTPKGNNYNDRLRFFLSILGDESDRGSALVITSLAEEMLGEILYSHLAETPQTKN